MPLRLDFTHHDGIKSVRLTVPLKVDPKRADILVTRCHVKINQTPYLLALDLYGNIDFKRSVIKVDSDSRTITIDMPKVEPGLWPAVAFEGSAEEAETRRSASIAEKVQADAEAKASESRIKQELSSAAVRQQMALEEAARKRVENALEQAKKEAADDVFRTFDERSAAEEAAPTAAGAGNTSIFEPEDHITSEETLRYVPPPRGTEGSATQEIKFTPRVFPTPLRESKKAEEESWLQRNANGLKQATGGQKASLSSTLDTISKAEAKFTVGDYTSAANAYRIVFDTSPVERAGISAQYALSLLLSGEPTIAVQTCTDQLKDADNAELIAKLQLIRAVASWLLGDLEAAAKDMDRLSTAEVGQNDEYRDMLEAYADCFAMDTAVNAKKMQADTAAAAGDYDAAQGLYQEAIALRPTCIPAQVNLTTILFKSGDNEMCVKLCKGALGILQVGPRVSPLLPTWFARAGSTAWPTALKTLRTKLLIKQAAASSQLGDIQGSLAAMKLAASLNPADGAIRADIAKLEAALAS